MMTATNHVKNQISELQKLLLLKVPRLKSKRVIITDAKWRNKTSFLCRQNIFFFQGVLEYLQLKDHRKYVQIIWITKSEPPMLCFHFVFFNVNLQTLYLLPIIKEQLCARTGSQL